MGSDDVDVGFVFDLRLIAERIDDIYLRGWLNDPHIDLAVLRLAAETFTPTASKVVCKSSTTVYNRQECSIIVRLVAVAGVSHGAPITAACDQLRAHANN